MNATPEMQRSLLSPPGDTIQETIELRGMTQAELAERIGRPKEKINDVIKGREPVSAETAYRLEKVLSIPASFWINREKEYRRQLYEIAQQEKLSHHHDWLMGFPLREMKKLGWLPSTKDKNILVGELLTFFGVATSQQWHKIYVSHEVSVAFRISLANTKSPHAMSAWLRKGELDAEKLQVAEYDKIAFKNTLYEIKQLVCDFPKGFAVKLQQKCAACGVAVVYVPTLPKAPISGASRWFHGNPLIQLSGRYKSDDHFWFTFFHEAGHILLHGKKDIFLEDVIGTEMDKTKEDEANAFASKYLLSESQLKEIIASPELNDDTIKTFAKKFNTSAGVIIGRLQHLKIINWSDGNNLRKTVDLFAS